MGKEEKTDDSEYGTVSWNEVFMLKSSVITKIYIPVILSSIWTVLLKILYDLIKDKSYFRIIFFPVSLKSFIGTVISLLLVFRNNSAYDRYWEGRKIWSQIVNCSRNVSRHIWISFTIADDDPEKEKKLNLKIGTLRLVVALVVSIKHALRGEDRMDYDDLANLLKHLPRFNSLLKEDPKQTIKHLPLKIVQYIDSICYEHLAQKPLKFVCQPTASIIEGYTSCQRIIDTPIPIIYRIHLKHILILYFASLPIQVVPECGWTSIVIVMLTAFTFFGIEAISSEIENPFGYDENDLLLDDFCQQIKEEINEMMKYFSCSGFIENEEWLKYEKIIEDGSTVLDVNKDDKNETINVIVKDNISKKNI